MAAEAIGSPPLNYPVDGVRFVIVDQPGSVQGRQTQRLELSGAGTATLSRGDVTSAFDYPPTELVRVLNAFYHINFFDLPPDMLRRTSVFLKDDGDVGTSLLRMKDQASTKVCIRLANYEKCVRYADSAPVALVTLVDQLKADADQRVAAAGSR